MPAHTNSSYKRPAPSPVLPVSRRPSSLTGPQTTSRRKKPTRYQRQRRWQQGRRIGFAIGGFLALLVVIYLMNTSSHPTGTHQAGVYPYQVASPGVGALAPEFTLPSTTGGTFDLQSQHGKTILLYFHEGIGCEPCWTQLKDLEAHRSVLSPLHIDTIVGITTNAMDALKQKVADEGITTPLLADTDMAVSTTYHANEYGMMGHAKDGHSFILVGPDGTIEWRADYGGPPDYTMYVPIPNLLADMQEGLHVK